MKCKLSDICAFRKGKVRVSSLTVKTYISTENMMPNKGGITEATSLPTMELTQEYKKGDILFSQKQAKRVSRYGCWECSKKSLCIIT